MNNKGQTAFETILVFLIITTAAVLILTLYTSINDDTSAMSIARAETNKQLAMKNENIQIVKIEMSKSPADTNLDITLDKNTALDTSIIKDQIIARTTLKNLRININVQ